MAVQYAVQAEVVDIRTDRPRATDIFLVDTNVWFWTTYAIASQGTPGGASLMGRAGAGLLGPRA